MKRLLLLILLFTIYSCEINDAGELAFIPEFVWFCLIFVLIIIISAIIGPSKGNPFDRMKKDGILQDNLIKVGSYVGGHPKIDDFIKISSIYKKEPNLIITDTRLIYPEYKGEIPIDKIKSILLEDSSTIENKITLGRVLLVGIFALAWRKKKKNELAFVTIDWTDGNFEHSTIFSFEGKDAMQTANTTRNRLIGEVSKSENKKALI
jgi:hypothetical protein